MGVVNFDKISILAFMAAYLVASLAAAVGLWTKLLGGWLTILLRIWLSGLGLGATGAWRAATFS